MAAIVIVTITITVLGTTVYIITLLLLISVASSLGTTITVTIEVVVVVIIAGDVDVTVACTSLTIQYSRDIHICCTELQYYIHPIHESLHVVVPLTCCSNAIINIYSITIYYSQHC